MARSHIAQLRHLDPAPLLGVATTRMEAAPRGRRKRTRHIARQDDALVMTGVIWLSMRLLPEVAKSESRVRAEHWLHAGKKGLLITGFLILLFVVVLGSGLVYLLWRALSG